MYLTLAVTWGIIFPISNKPYGNSICVSRLMDSLKQKIKAFFQDYEDRFARALEGDNKIEGAVDDIEGTVNAFAENFIEANPAGVIVGKNDESFRKMIPKGNEFYRSIGTRSMKIRDIEITMLNDYHVLATVDWDSRYERTDGKSIAIEFQVIYLLQYRDDALKIFAYITGDEQKALKEAGLI
jgi:hypothetical protein